jgi:hypothetical protein
MSAKPPFLEELKRRNVIRAAILYIGAVWALAQGISQLGPSVGAPEWGTRWFFWSLQRSVFRSGSRSLGSTNSRRKV